MINEGKPLKTIRAQDDVVGLIPAGGTGSRIAPLPMSKELFPIGFQANTGYDSPRPKVVSHYLLDKFAKAGIHKAFIIIRNGKWDIPAYFGDGASVNMHLGYLLMRDPFGPPFTLDQAYPFVQDKVIAFGFPDILFNPEDAFQQLLDRQNSVLSDVVLGLYPAHDHRVMDMVDVRVNGKVHGIYLKPSKTVLKLAWLCAVWTPIFTEFMHKFLQVYRKKNFVKGDQIKKKTMGRNDLPVGAVIQAAIEKGLNVCGVTFPKGKYLDIGTPHDLIKASKF
ncbi:MAG: sugar phosphate nucleotidyltransferase [Nitrospirota bacterium]